jgi:hypothetical protein
MNAEERYRDEAHILTKERDDALAEVEWLRRQVGDMNAASWEFEAQEKELRAEVERLRALYDLHTGGNECPFEVELAEVRRGWQEQTAIFAQERAEVERLRAVLKTVTDAIYPLGASMTGIEGYSQVDLEAARNALAGEKE